MESLKYHKSMKKVQKTQEKKGEATKSAPRKRTAPKAKPPRKKGSTAMEDELIDAEKIPSLEERALDLSLEARLKSDEELRLSDSVEHSQLRREIEKAYRTGGLARVRELLVTSDYAGMVAMAAFFIDDGVFHFPWLKPSSRSQSAQDYYAAWKDDALKLREKNGLREREVTRIEQRENLQKGAEEALHKKGESGLAEYIRQHKEKLDITGDYFWVDIATTPEKDSLYIDWKDDIKKEGKEAIPVYFPPLDKKLLEEDIGEFHKKGLLNDGSLAKFLAKAGLNVALLMRSYEVNIDRIYAEAARGLARVKRGDVIFTEDEVFRLVSEQSSEKRGHLYNKMRDEKRDFTNRFPFCPPI